MLFVWSQDFGVFKCASKIKMEDSCPRDLAIKVADWDSMGCVITQTCGRSFQTIVRAFSLLLNPQKLGRVFQKLG